MNCKLFAVARPLLHIDKPVHNISVNLCQRQPKVRDKLNISSYTMVVTHSKHTYNGEIHWNGTSINAGFVGTPGY